MEDVIHQMTEKFVTGLLSTLKKDSKMTSNPLTADPSIQLLIHIISCTKRLKDLYEQQQKESERNKKKNEDFSSHLSLQLIQPSLNSFVSSYGKILMDSFTFEPKVSVPTSVHPKLFAAYSLLGKHILNQFPEMVMKKHKSNGKVLLHHCVFKSRPSIAEESAKQILKLEPDSAQTADFSGALPLHWAVRNTEVTMDLLDLLIRAHPAGPSVRDSKQGFLPLHWAVAQDHPNLEAVRKLLKVYPAGAATEDNVGAVPLHVCVDRDRPSTAVMNTLLAAYPEAVKTQCSEDGYLPVHLLVNREHIDLEVLKLLVSYYPESLSVLSTRHQAPLHRALEHQSTALSGSTPRTDLPSSSDPSEARRGGQGGWAAIQYLLSQCPSVVSVQGDTDGYLPLHLVLDCASPDYATASTVLQAYPQACHYLSKEGMLPMHVLLASAVAPPLVFVKELLDTYPQCLFHSVSDIVPLQGWDAMSEKQGGSSSASSSNLSLDMEAWSGEWQERKWTPLSRAVERGLTDIVALFKRSLAQLSSSGAGGTGVYVSPVVFTDSHGVVHTPPVVAGGGSVSSGGSSMQYNRGGGGKANNLHSPPVLSRGNSSGSRPKKGGPASDSGGGVVMVDNFVRPTSQNADRGAPSTAARGANFNPVMKLPPNILRAQLSQSMKLQQQQPGGSSQGGSINAGSAVVSTGAASPKGGANAKRSTSPSGGGSRAPPSGPIPSSLRQAAENSAIRYSQQNNSGQNFAFNRPRQIPKQEDFGDSVGITIDNSEQFSKTSVISNSPGGGNSGGGRLFSQTIDVSVLHQQQQLPPLKAGGAGNRRDEMV
jgi:hypothetical protein